MSGIVTQKTIASIDLIFSQEVLCPRASVLQYDDPDLDADLDIRIYFTDSSPLVDRTKYTTTSNVRYDENMHYDVTSEGLSFLIALY